MNQNQIKTVVFLSNYFSHHQKPFSDEMCALLGDGYLFIETVAMDDERKNMGWGLNSLPNYVITAEELRRNQNIINDIINTADVVITGSAPENLLSQRKKERKLILRYSERQLKKGTEPLKYLYRLVKWQLKNYPRDNIYMLSASAYTAADYAKFGLFKNRCYKWGYFPALKRYENVDALISQKKRNSIIWVARFIDWKHPEIALDVAAKLKEEGYDFQLNMIGNGELLKKIKNDVLTRNLSEHITILGAMTPEEVRLYMEKSAIHIFTSDRNEGWGAVLNESMNSACAVIASHAIGAVPFMIQDGVNGLIYQDGNKEDLYQKVKRILNDNDLCCLYGKKAYETITEKWNERIAANRFMELSNALLSGSKGEPLFDDGPCSIARILEDEWYNRNEQNI